VALDKAATDAIGPCLVAAVYELQSRKALFLGTKSIRAESASEISMEIGFKKVSAELMLSKSV
jgi:hypothetical protein